MTSPIGIEPMTPSHAAAGAKSQQKISARDGAAADGAATSDGAAAALDGTDTANAATIGDVPAQNGNPAGGGTEAATMIPGLLGTLAGTVGGALGAAVSAAERIPSTMMGAIGPAMTALTGARNTDTASPWDTVTATSPGYDPGLTAGPGDTGIGGDGATTPAAGPLPTVLPVTGPSPTAPVTPPGGAATPNPAPSAGGGGAPMMPMGMPMGGQTGGQTPAASTETRSKKLSTTPQPHTEPVAGKTPTERIALASKPRDQEPIVRRVTLPETKE